MPELIEEILCLVDIKRNTIFIMPTMTSPAKFVMLEKRFSSNDCPAKSLLIDLIKFDYAMELQDETQIDFDNSLSFS